MKKGLSNIIIILVFLIGLSLLLYPTISDRWNQLHQAKAIGEYTEKVSFLDEETYKKMWEEAQAYNEDTANRLNSYVQTDRQKENYNNLLNINENGIMGYIEIPSIDCNLPVYHGTSNSILQRAVGHIEWSSLPVGGENTHCILSGHRGLPRAKLLTDLSKVKVGDIFIIHVLNEKLTYEVDQILVVEPDDTSELRIVKDEDLCTLVTCTPYGINTHRLLVRGHRIDNIVVNKAIYVTTDAIQINPVVVALVLSILLLIVFTVSQIVLGRKNDSERKKYRDGENEQL